MGSRLTRHSPIRAALISAVLVIPLLLGLAVPGAKAQTGSGPSSTPQEKVAALIEPTIVFLNAELSYYVDTGASGLGYLGPFSIQASCTGFFVSPDGYIVTAGHCSDVKPGGALSQFAIINGLQAIIDEAIADGTLTAEPTDAEMQEVLSEALGFWKVEGASAGSDPQLTITVFQPVGVSGQQASTGKVARVVESTSFEDGDVSLLKIEQTNTPVALLGKDSDVSVGTAVMAAGYPGVETGLIDTTMTPTFKDGQINNKGTREGLKIPVYETSANVSKGMSGGPVSNLDGNVIGVISYGVGDGFNFISPSTLASELVSRNNVKNELGTVDKAYREGLDAYFSGDYATAVEQFDKVLGIAPGHYLAQQFKQKANEKLADAPATSTTKADKADASSSKKDDDKGSSSSGILFVIIGIVALLVVVAIILVVVMKGKGKKDTPPAPGAGTPVPPVPPVPPVATPPAPTAPPAAPTAPPAAPAPTAPVPPAAPTGAEPTAPQAATGAFCSQCGNPLTAGERFCGSCGKDQQA